jgi:hypothetical protein
VQRDGKRVRDPGPDGADRLEAVLETLATVEGAAAKAAASPLVIRADTWTEMHHVVCIVEACGRTSVPIARVLLGVRPAAGAQGAREPEPVKR